MDATVNWISDSIENDYTFFTDSNGLGIVKRQYKPVHDFIPEVHSEGPANWFPVNTALFIEDEDS